MASSSLTNNNIVKRNSLPIYESSRTLANQPSTLRMPVPQLKTSIDKFLTAVKPLLDDKDFEKTKMITSDFAKEGGIGEKLQTLLEERYKNTDNWVHFIFPLND